jgi:asparagine synthase (glutamine-hydrolysing)
MCGIAGLVEPDGDPTAVLGRLLDGIVHRGPDDHGVNVTGSLGIGVRRLCIIDVAGGHQPFVSEDGTLAVVGNGEIYNHDGLRDRLRRAGHRFRSGSDVETVLHLFEDDGPATFAQLRGMFAVAVADGRNHSLVLARDRYGIKPLYYATGPGGRFAFASEYRTLLQLPWVSRQPDVDALRQFSAWGWVAPPATALRSVRKLGPGEMLIAGPSGVTTTAWFERRYPERGQEQDRSAEEVLDLLDQTVASHLMSEVPLGIFLSGGLDSSLVAALAARHQPGLRSFTVRFAGDPDGGDPAAAAAVARALDLEHEELTVDPAPAAVLATVARHHDEPVGDVACIPTYLMAAAARERVTVVLTGEGGDEAFAGYRKYDHLATRARVPELVRSGAARAVGALPARRAGKLAGWLSAPDDVAPLRYDEVFTERERCLLFTDGRGTVEEPVAPPGLSPLDAALHVDSGWPLSEQLNMKLDKMTMANSLEARVPFLDHVVMEAAAFLPAAAKRRKAILRQAAASLLPPSVLERPKHGFTVPVGSWLNGDLRPYVDELLADGRLRTQGIFEPGTVASVRADHAAGQGGRSRQLWNLLAVQMWFEEVLG